MGFSCPIPYIITEGGGSDMPNVTDQFPDNSGSTQSNNNSQFTNDDQIELLKSIDATLKTLLKNAGNFSQSNARNAMGDNRGSFRQQYDESSRDSRYRNRKQRRGSFTDELFDSVFDEVLGGDFKKQINDIVSGFAKDFGVSIEDLPGELGHQIGKVGMNAFKQSNFGKKIFSGIDNAKGKAFDFIYKNFEKGSSKYGQSNAGDAMRRAAEFFNRGGSRAATSAATSGASSGVASGLRETVSSVAGEAIGGSGLSGAAGTVAGGGEALVTASSVAGTSAAAGGASAAIGGLASAASAACPYILAAVVAIELLSDAVGPAVQGFKELWKSMKASANRYNDSRKKMIENEKERLRKDVETLVSEPFEILKAAAQNLYDTWDKNIQKINATQGYTKEDLQDLMASYAERIRSEGLTRYVSGADITQNLAKVIDAGLSGLAAEEFAYQATKLNAAVPTQDFFSYAETYASIAATAIKNGKSEAEAISYANQQMELFASNVLYASRQISGGFSAGLKDASELFKQSVQITQAAKGGNPSQLSGVLTSVAAITGSIAPDLATSITDAIVKAATGGNSSEIVALRSLAGINAGNTEFLRVLVSNPQKIFSNLFTNLAKMQNMSNDNFMEVAEGLSSVFGLSMDAFARVDFNYLADAINKMSVNTASLEENMSLLKAGETTTTAEQLRMQQINEYMINEGLAYVLDNEAARAIQQHMWDEQIANELMEAQYAVDLQGSALTFLEGIRETIDNILTILNPFRLFKKLIDLVGTAAEGSSQRADVASILNAGKIGQGNMQDFYNLTTTGVDLDITPNLAELLTGKSYYSRASSIRTGARNFVDLTSTFMNPLGQILYDAADRQAIDFGSTGSYAGSPSSSYKWGTVSKSTASLLSQATSSYNDSIQSLSYTSSVTPDQATQESTNNSVLKANFEKMLESVESVVSSGGSYEDWVKTAGQFKISDFNDAIDQLGYTESQLKGYFQNAQVEEGAKMEDERKKREEDFWKNTQDYELQLIDLSTAGNKILNYILDTNKAFKKSFEDYFVNHVFYSNAYDHSDVVRIQKDEQYKASDAITALAEALTGASDLTDPTIQTNALLSQILIVVQAMLNQNNTTGKLSLVDTLSGMGLGLVKYDSI